MSRTRIATGSWTTQLPSQNSDEIWTIDELIKRRASELKNATLLAYPKEGLTDYEEHSALAIDRYVDAAVDALHQRGLQIVVSAH